MATALHKNLVISQRIFRFIITLVVSIIIIVAVSLATLSVIEKSNFDEAREQMLNIVLNARDAAKDKDFANGQPEDILAVLNRAGLLGNAGPLMGNNIGGFFTLRNPWHQKLIGKQPAASEIRLEVDVPVHECRRLAQYFVTQAKITGLIMAEAREGRTGPWRRFYENSQTILANMKPIEAACGEQPLASLALVFRLR